jgi:hypothetical protein
MPFDREATDATESPDHTTPGTARLRFLFIAAKIWRHSGRSGVRFSVHYKAKGLFKRLRNGCEPKSRAETALRRSWKAHLSEHEKKPEGYETKSCHTRVPVAAPKPQTEVLAFDEISLISKGEQPSNRVRRLDIRDRRGNFRGGP